MINIEIKGVERLEARIRKICANFPDTVRESAVQAAEDTRKIAVRLARGSALKRCIKAEIVDTNTGEVITSRVFNDTSEVFWSSYVEFGTGLYVDNEDVPDAIKLKRAKEIPWYIHVSMVPESFAKYGYPRVGDFWVVSGMRPHPYLKPAAFERRSKNAQEIISAIHKMIEEASM